MILSSIIQRAVQLKQAQSVDPDGIPFSTAKSFVLGSGTVAFPSLLRPTQPLINLIPSAPAVLNADRPIADGPTPTAPAASGEMSSHIAQLPAMSVVASPLSSFDWKKYLPWIVVVIVVLGLLMASRRKSS